MLPQIIYLILTCLGLGVVMSKHGEPQKPYNIWYSLTSTVLLWILLYWGGFFNCFSK